MEEKPSQTERTAWDVWLVSKASLTLLEYQNSKLGAAGRQDQILQSFEFLAKDFRYYLEASVSTLEEMINIWTWVSYHLFEECREISYEALTGVQAPGWGTNRQGWEGHETKRSEEAESVRTSYVVDVVGAVPRMLGESPVQYKCSEFCVTVWMLIETGGHRKSTPGRQD